MRNDLTKIGFSTTDIVNSFIAKTFEEIIKLSMRDGFDKFIYNFNNSKGCWCEYKNEEEMSFRFSFYLDGKEIELKPQLLISYIKNLKQ